MGKFKIQKSDTVNVGFNYNDVVDGVNIGGTGGNTSIAGNQIQVWANLAVSRDDAYIVSGRGKGKFLVSNGNVSTTCTLVNKHKDNLLAGEMSMVAVPYSTSYFYVSRMTNKFVWDFEPVPNKYLWTGGEAQDSGNDPLVGLPIVRIPLA